LRIRSESFISVGMINIIRNRKLISINIIRTHS
jgi:hypothetical protein